MTKKIIRSVTPFYSGVKTETTQPNTGESGGSTSGSTSGGSTDGSGDSGGTTTTYNSPTYSDSYREGIDTSYYTNAISKYTDAQEKNRATQLSQAQKQQTSALRDAYINKLQNQKTLNRSLAESGIRGGATETSNLKLANTYATQRNAANTDYANSVNSINQSVDDNILNYDMDMTSRAEEYTQNLAQAKWQAAREDYANSIAQQNADREYKLQLEEREETRNANEQTRLSNIQNDAYDRDYAIYKSYSATGSNVKALRAKIAEYQKYISSGKNSSGRTLTAEQKARYQGLIRAAADGITYLKSQKNYKANK